MKELLRHPRLIENPTRPTLIHEAIGAKEAMVTASGALATWSPSSSTGRSPDDTYIVKRAESEHTIDWTSPNSHAMSSEVFDVLFESAIKWLRGSPKLYALDRVIGAEARYALPTRVLTDRALTALFADTMFRPIPADIFKSIFAGKGFTVVVAPTHSAASSVYPKPIAIAMDLDRRICLVIGTRYVGTVKKMLFTVMNYLLPAEGILPLHASAMESETGEVTVILGLSGTGKTTLSSDPRHFFIGDDEVGWSEQGIANFEYGCYAKLIHLDPTREPAIYNAALGKRPIEENGCIIENALTYPDGTIDLDDGRLTENSRTAYPISFLPKVKEEAAGGHPRTILFLAADAHGVLPPVARLTPEQSVLWFLMGYTSKLAGTEVGVVEPKTAFSRFFGQPFMPRLPSDYTRLFQQYIERYKTPVYLVNTGWSEGPYGIGKRMDILLTRKIVDAAIGGQLAVVSYDEDPLFHIMVPRECPGVPSQVLHPKETWQDKEAFALRANKLAQSFSEYFDKNFVHQGFDERIVKQCPGK